MRRSENTANLMLGIEEIAHRSGKKTITVKTAMDELFIINMGSLLGQGLIKFDSIGTDLDFNQVVFYGTRITIKGRVWYALHTFGSLWMTAERDILIEKTASKEK